MQEVHVGSVPIDRLVPLLSPARVARLVEYVDRGRSLLDGRIVWNLNATAAGGGVAEMLEALLAYSRGAGVDARWLVLDGSPEFFRITKRIHNLLHGDRGDGGPLGEVERAVYDTTLAANLEQFRSQARAGDIVLLHDPQTAGLSAAAKELGCHVIWRCHVGRDTPTPVTDVAWAFLRPHIEAADAAIFSRREYAPDWVDPEKVWVIPPSLDPFTAKNAELDPAVVDATLCRTGLVGLADNCPEVVFFRRDGSAGKLRTHAHLALTDGIVPGDARIVVQVSRWDRLKDMAGVLSGFAARLPHLPDDVHLMLVGPDSAGVSDDPEGAEVLAECRQLWARQSPDARSRIHLVSVPMDDGDENAHIVNALQRHASVVVQKSLVEGFGLTVAEAMWKARPVIGSRVGGIQDQIVDRESGLLLADPTDLDEFGKLLESVLGDPDLAAELGPAARERVRNDYLGDRHLEQYVELFEQLLRT